jgi:hypothetical protein
MSVFSVHGKPSVRAGLAGGSQDGEDGRLAPEQLTSCSQSYKHTAGRQRPSFASPETHMRMTPGNLLLVVPVAQRVGPLGQRHRHSWLLLEVALLTLESRASYVGSTR